MLTWQFLTRNTNSSWWKSCVWLTHLPPPPRPPSATSVDYLDLLPDYTTWFFYHLTVYFNGSLSYVTSHAPNQIQKHSTFVWFSKTAFFLVMGCFAHCTPTQMTHLLPPHCLYFFPEGTQPVSNWFTKYLHSHFLDLTFSILIWMFAYQDYKFTFSSADAALDVFFVPEPGTDTATLCRRNLIPTKPGAERVSEAEINQTLACK